MNSAILKELEARDLIFQITHEELDSELANRSMTLYCGFDPTAESLHVGSLLPIIVLAQFRRHGHNPIPLVGGATGLIGDPSGKSEERTLLDEAEIHRNVEGIASQIRSILDRALEVHPTAGMALGDDDNGGSIPIPFANNADWMTRWSYIDFLREIGKHFRVNQMLQKDSVRARLEEREQGISYTEFSYMLIQAYDFLHLFETHGCELQAGGSDQWGNITAGTELIRRKLGKPAYGLTFPLLLTPTGQKFGKTEAGAVWLDPERTSPYEFYQYWVRREDAEVVDLLRKFTFLPLSEIEEHAARVARSENQGDVQRVLAYEVTSLVHGAEEADKAVRASKMLFGETIEGLSDRDLAAVFAEVPSSTMPRDRLHGGVNIVELLDEVGLQPSRGAARKLVGQGGAYINNVRVVGIDTLVTLEHLASPTKLVLRAGKRNYHVISIE